MAYLIEKRDVQISTLVPVSGVLKDGTEVTLNYAVEEDYETLRGMLNAVIEEGMTYPQLNTLDEAQFRAYFSPSVFVAKRAKDNQIMGTFYIKPNFPGRCSHICNGGFIVKPEFRGQGLAYFLGKNFLVLAKDLGYRASMFNLVFESNVPSVRVWRSLGFKEIGRVPKAGLLKDGNYHDAIQFYYDLLSL
eukprot:TRINITY_DN28273_c0_g1_i1.p1 TRINITY_DN28273_c0_g1~~TRINITY_DN28273_c0_g1_i1.p1  ORF type:complete len:190 (-),score=37.36 TRINITY_DN28273_c0_g1_i1:47-616(-)